MTYRGPGWAGDLASQLEKWKTSTGVMAELRRGRGKDPVDCVSMHRWVSRFVTEQQVGSGKEWAVYTVAAQFALHPDLRSTDHSLGWSLEQLAQHSSLSSEHIQARMIHLTRSRTCAELCRRLPGIIGLIASGGVPLSWSLLAADISRWDFDPSRVTRNWLRDFFIPSTASIHEHTALIATKGDT